MSTEQRNFVKVIDKSSKMLLALISDILDFSKIESGKMQLESVKFSLSDCLDSIVSVMNVKIPAEKPLHIVVKKSITEDVVIGDEMRLTQVLVNLLANAIKFSDQGDIIVEASSEIIDSNRVQAKFRVIDNGIGIDTNKQSFLFQSFSQQDSSISKKYGGSGLGLALSKQIIEMMGGEMILEKSSLGNGSTFAFTCLLDRSLEEECQTIETNIEMESLPNDFKVLCAEDNAVNRMVMIKMLNNIGITNIVMAEDGQQAFIKYQEHGGNFDLALMDLNMPHMDGIESTQNIREYEEKMRLKRCPIIAVTATATETQRLQCLSANMNQFLTVC